MAIKKYSALFVFIFVFIAPFPAKADAKHLAHPTAKNIPQICVGGYLNRGRLAAWLYYNNPEKVPTTFKSSKQLLEALRHPHRQHGESGEIVTKFLQYTLDIIGTKGFKAEFNIRLGAEAFYNNSTLSVKCVPSLVSPPKPAGGSVTPPVAGTGQQGKNAKTSVTIAEQLRVRGTTASLIFPHDGPTGYSSSPGATLSFSQDGTKNTAKNVLHVALGYDVEFKMSDQKKGIAQNLDIIPFGFVDRSIATSSGVVSASSRENLIAGITAGWTIISSQGINILTGTVEHVWDNINSSQQRVLAISDTPVVNGWLNDYHWVPCMFRDRGCSGPSDAWFAVMPILNIRLDAGHYIQRGNPASPLYDQNVNYTQLGGQFGFDLGIDRLSSNLRVTELYMQDLGQTRKNISLFDAAFTYYPFKANGNKAIGLQASYENGNLEATAQRVQQWLISFSFKY